MTEQNNKAHELAEKIKQMQETWNMGMSWSQKGGLWGEVESLLSSALEEVQNKAYAAGRLEEFNVSNRAAVDMDKTLKLERAAALEEAAKIAESIPAECTESCDTYSHDQDCGYLDQRDVIAKRIRQLAEKEKSE